MSKSGSFSSLADWLGWLETLAPNEIDLGLERVALVLQRLNLGRPERVIHVAGTNGKGSTVAMLESLYLQASSSVGSYTSPHIHRYNERIRFAGRDVADKQILEAFARVESCRQDVALTYFEYGTLAALCVFDQAAAKTVILEIGMGGRLDAVNAVEPDGGIICNVSLDHCEWLGHDVETIAVEKAGILRGGKPFVYGDFNRPAAIDNAARILGTDLRACGRDYRFSVNEDGWDFESSGLCLRNLRLPALPGRIQVQNAAGVIALVEALNDVSLLTPQTIDTAFANLALQGRFQSLNYGKRWLIDVAHNPGAAKILAESLEASHLRGEVTCIIGMLNDKDVAAVIALLEPHVDTWIAITADGPRAMAAHELGRIVANGSDKHCLVANSISEACIVAGSGGSGDDVVLVTGSFMTVGPVLRWLSDSNTCLAL